MKGNISHNHKELERFTILNLNTNHLLKVKAIHSTLNYLQLVSDLEINYDSSDYSIDNYGD